MKKLLFIFVMGSFAAAMVGCQLIPSRNSEITSTEPAAPSATPSAVEEPKVIASPTVEVDESEPEPAGPPTAEPLELGSTEELALLASGQELVITKINMMDRALGWALGGNGQDLQRVLRTTDGGQSFQEVTPPIRRSLLSTNYQITANFLDADHAQILRYEPDERGGESRSSVLVVWRTEDGGASWQASQPIRVPFIAVEGLEPYWDYGQGESGWILARRGGVGMHQYPVALIKTEDEGASWQIQHGPFDTPDPGLTGCTKSGMAFGSGGAGLLTISDCPYEEALVMATVDGGDSWQANLLPAPQGYEDEYQQAAGGGCSAHSPVVLSAESWRVAVLCRVFDEQERRLSFLYSSQDGGASWQAREIPEGRLTFLSPERGWALGRELFRTEDGGASWQFVKAVNWDGQFSFVDMAQAWAVARSDEGELALVATEDGAETWQIIKPIVR